ncbi:MAG: hypothetical protein AB2766_17995, partial [Candidatus Thiodiazotropha endolucinida]
IVAIYSVSRDVMFVLCIKKTGEAESFLLIPKQQKVKAISLVRISLTQQRLRRIIERQKREAGNGRPV